MQYEDIVLLAHAVSRLEDKYDESFIVSTCILSFSCLNNWVEAERLMEDDTMGNFMSSAN